MEDLTKLTKKIRAEGLTDNTRSEIIAAYKKLNEATPAPADSAGSARRENSTSSPSPAQAARERMVSRGNKQEVSSSAQAARERMVSRSIGSDRDGVLYGHGETFGHGEVTST